ncbi:MAG: glycosyltransferase [Patescibacteria group bacterium]
MARRLKVALVHELLTQLGGGERILVEFSRMFPDAKIYTMIHDPDKIGNAIDPARVITSPLQSMPFSQQLYKWYVPVMDWAIEQFQLPDDLDLVLSDASAFAKGVRAPKGVPHLCYLHTPTRYLWSVQESYVREQPIPALIRPFVKPGLQRLKRWDYIAAQRPHAYVANSTNVAEQLQRYYDRSAEAVIFPFVDTSLFQTSTKVDDYYFILTRLEPYKRVDLVVDACIQLGARLKVAGSGTLLEELRVRYADQPTIEFLGRVTDEALPDLYANARAFIFPQEEDAGITPLESMAAGRPVLAYGKGGALQSVVPGVTGEFFEEQSVDSIAAALTKYDWTSYTSKAIQAHVAQFDVTEFRDKMHTVIETVRDRWHFQHNQPVKG